MKKSALLLSLISVLGVINASQERHSLCVADDFKLSALQEHLKEVCTNFDLQKNVKLLKF